MSTLKPVNPQQRFSAQNPCPICGGYPSLPHHQGVRCTGYEGRDGRIYCSRENYAGNLPPNLNTTPPTYAHSRGACGCGIDHKLGPVSEIYSYSDNGTTHYEIVRHLNKEFRPRRFSNGRYHNDLKVPARILYNLDAVKAAGPNDVIFYCEGEKDAETCKRHGLVATTHAGGANGWKPELAVYLRGRNVVVLPDNDDDGRAMVTKMKPSLLPIVGELKVLQLPSLAEHGDVSDWFASGGTQGDLLKLAEAATVERISPIEVTWAEAITAKPIEWMWKGRIARGKLTLIGGDPGLGKGLLGIDTAMRVSTGTAWPDGERCPQGRVLLLTGEDDPEDTVKPRLEAAGADVCKVGLVGITLDGKRVNLVDHAQLLVETAVQVGASVLVIDPLSSYLGPGSGKINAWRAQDIRAVLDPLVESLRGTQLALIVVVHLNKTEGQRAMYRLSDSIAILAAARIGFLVAPHPDDPDVRVLAALKSNISKKPLSLSFEIEDVFVASVNDSIGRVRWLHEVEITADDLVGVKEQESPRATLRAQEFLSDLLSDGGVASTEVEAKAKTQGIGRGSLWEAKKQMGVVARKVAHDGWVWDLPIRITVKKTDQVEA
jgi:hypothetical protein